MTTIYTNYFYNPKDYDNQDDSYFPLKKPTGKQSQLNIPNVLAPKKETPTDIYYTIVAQRGSTQFLPGQATRTLGYNQSFDGKTLIFKRGKKHHLTLQNNLNVPTTFHLHGLRVPGDADNAYVKPHSKTTVNFVVTQPAATCWLHAHPYMQTSEQVWQGLAAMIVIKDNEEAQLPLPRNYGVDDVPLLLQDRTFHENNQFDYNKDHDDDGTLGDTAVIDGTVNPYFNVTTQKVRLRLLDGSNRREWRLHFDRNLQFTQIGSDGSLLPHPIKFTKLMLTCAERAEIIVDFGACQPGSTIYLYSDDTPIVAFRIGNNLKKDNTVLPDNLNNVPDLPVTKFTPTHNVVMNGMDNMVNINGRKYDPMRIDSIQKMNNVEIWNVTNSNKINGGMLHPYHSHGTQFKILNRNGKQPYPNEVGTYKDTVAVQPQETVQLKVRYDCAGIFMYHCHIIEHGENGMMAQIKVIDPKNPKQKYNMNM